MTVCEYIIGAILIVFSLLIIIVVLLQEGNEGNVGVISGSSDTFMDKGKARFSFLSVACMHCDDAPCVMGCPSACLYKDPESGLTLFDNTNCIGCHSCAMACPFGAPSFNDEGKMVKCDGCVERLRQGLIPACVRVCPTGALTCVPESQYHQVQSEKSLRSLSKRLLQD